MNKHAVCLLLICCCVTTVRAQVSNAELTSHAGLNAVVATFKECLIKKDSVQFFRLFHEEPVTWFRIIDQTKHGSKLKDSTTRDHFDENVRDFYRYISRQGFTDMKLDNLEIAQDDYVASIQFDYSFWKGRKKKIWGRESWGLIYKTNQWEIMRVIYSLELESENPEPKGGSAKVNKQ